jgi:hypothetical protein
MIQPEPSLSDPFSFSFVLVLAPVYINTKKGDYQISDKNLLACKVYNGVCRKRTGRENMYALLLMKSHRP